MHKICLILTLTFVFSIQSIFANNAIIPSSKPCKTIANACMSAGFSQKENGHEKFWMDCMKPVLLGKTVKNVTVESSTIKSCRSNKIDILKKELNDFESVR